MSPIVGVRYTKPSGHEDGNSYDLCQAEFDKITSPEESALYTAITTPVEEEDDDEDNEDDEEEDEAFAEAKRIIKQADGDDELRRIIERDLLLVQRHSSSINKKRTLLMEAAKYGRVRCVAALARYGAKLDERDTKGQSAVHYATWNGWPEVLRCVRAGAFSRSCRVYDLPVMTRRSSLFTTRARLRVDGACQKSLSECPNLRGRSRPRTFADEKMIADRCICGLVCICVLFRTVRSCPPAACPSVMADSWWI